jgi:hypothetical protein
VVEKEVFVFDSQTLHALSGRKWEVDEVADTLARVPALWLSAGGLDSWQYADEVMTRLRLARLRPRSTWLCLLTFCTCACMCADCCAYSLDRNRELLYPGLDMWHQ